LTIFCKELPTEFHENSTRGLVADTGSQTDGRVHTNNVFLLCTEPRKTVLCEVTEECHQTETVFLLLPEVLFTMKHDIENQIFQCNMQQH